LSVIAAFLRRSWPQRLAGQMIALLLLALVLAQVVALVIFAGERTTAIRTVERKQILERTASVLRLIESTPPAVHEQIVRTASSWHLRFWLAPVSAVPETASGAGSEIRARLETLLDDTADPREILVEFRDDDGWWQGARDPARPQRARGAARADEPVVLAVREQRRWLAGNRPRLLISARLDDGRWLNAGLRVRTPPPPWALPPLLPLGLTAIALCAIVMLTVRRITRPLERLASAAERVGRGETIPPIAEEGPLDVRQTTAAFNRMRERLQRFVQDRTRMLAAISHDLRTPITSLRLRAEFVDDEETRQKILETLDEMQRMTEATLVFAREEATREDTRTVDLSALVESLCLDLADMGMDVAFAGPGKMPYDCRPLGLKRAVRNLVENAVCYGQRARVVLAAAPDELEIVIDDDGPGIPESDFERVFAPFVRLEESRSRETGGIGLGMAIARSIVRGHGGDIALANRDDGGLRVTVRLPRTERH
jgi:signal transduction histidine kinase